MQQKVLTKGKVPVESIRALARKEIYQHRHQSQNKDGQKDCSTGREVFFLHCRVLIAK